MILSRTLESCSECYQIVVTGGNLRGVVVPFALEWLYRFWALWLRFSQKASVGLTITPVLANGQLVVASKSQSYLFLQSGLKGPSICYQLRA